jgi:hypothetical protein
MYAQTVSVGNIVPKGPHRRIKNKWKYKKIDLEGIGSRDVERNYLAF